MRRAGARLVLAPIILGALAAAVPSDAARPSETVDKSYVATLNGPCGIAIDGNDRKIIADTGNNRVIVLGKDFEPVGVIEGTRRGGPLKRPRGVACDAENRILVADTGNHCVKVYDEKGYYRFAIGRHDQPGSSAGALKAPEGVTVDPKGNIIVFDTGNKRVQIFDPDGKYIMQFRRGSYTAERLTGSPDKPHVKADSGEIVLDRPVRGCILGDGNLVVADYYAGRYSVWRYSTSKKTARPVKYVEPKENGPDYWAGDVACDPKHNEVHYLEAHSPLTDHDHLRVAKVRTDTLEAYPAAYRMLKTKPEDWPPYYETNNFTNGRFLEPRGVAVDSRGNAVVVDRRLNFAVQISRRQIEKQWNPDAPPFTHKIAEVTANSVVIEYTTFEKVPTLIEYGVSERFTYGGPHAFTTRVEDDAASRHHRVRLGGLEPGKRYVYRYLTSRNAYPREHFSEARVVTTIPRSGETAYLDLEVLVVLFADIVTMPEPETLPKDADGNPLVPEKPGPMTPDEIARVKADLERARGFYWINSHMKMNLRFDFLEVGEHSEGFPFEHYAYYPLKDRKKLDEILIAHGRRTHGNRGGIVVIYGARHWDARKKEWVLSGSGGNTWGSPYDGSGICVFNAGGDTAWLFTHEYGHQLGIMGAYTGHVYHFNHFHDNDLVGDYGTHWDGNAFIAREYSPHAYLANFYGSVKIVKDTDNDGFPDDDPTCPFDEKRFGTRPYSADSDSDGVDDLAEAMFSEWLTSDGVGLDFTTFGARTAKPYFRPLPYSPDTDEDGIPDAADEFPLYRFWPEVRKSNVTIDGEIGPNEWAEQSSRVIDDPVFKGVFRMNWRDEGLCFLIEQRITPEQAEAYTTSGRPMRVMLRLDGNNDGWTVGSDNVTIWLDAQPGGTAKVRTQHCDNSVRKHAVWTENTVIKPEDVEAAWTVSGDGVASGDRFVLEFMVPRSIEAGINCVIGEQIGFEIEFRPDGAEYGLRLFEPQVLFDVTLK